MTKHRIAIATASLVLAIGVFLPVAPANAIEEAGPAIPALDWLWNRNQSVSLQFTNAPAAEVLHAIAVAGNFHLETEGPTGCCPVSLSLTDVPVRQALEDVAVQTWLRYEVVNANSLRVKLFAPQAPTEDMTMPEVLTRVEPLYPKDARDARAGGKVIIQALIREDGTVADAKILSEPDGWPSLGEAALIAVRQRTYRPAMKDGKPVSIDVTLKVEFALR